MALNNPPPYFPQSSLSPPDPNRYRKFKLIVAAVVLFLVLLVVGAGVGIYYLIRSVI
jgi:cell division septal protein FtsQ